MTKPVTLEAAIQDNLQLTLEERIKCRTRFKLRHYLSFGLFGRGGVWAPVVSKIRCTDGVSDLAEEEIER
jgi:hypothetical protein